MGKDEISVVGTANIFDMAWSIHDEKKAKKLVMAIDESQADAGFTEDLIISLIKSMKKEYKGFSSEMDEFSKRIQSALT